MRALLHFSNLPLTYWAEAYNFFTYVHNRVGKSSQADDSPYEVLHGTKPDVSHIRTFRYTAYMHVPPEKHSKLNSKAVRCILVGFCDTAAYWLMDPNMHEIHYSKDIIFDEDNSFLKSNVSAENEIYLDNKDPEDGPLPPAMQKTSTRAI